jgi:hypothetical protein
LPTLAIVYISVYSYGLRTVTLPYQFTRIIRDLTRDLLRYTAIRFYYNHRVTKPKVLRPYDVCNNTTSNNLRLKLPSLKRNVSPLDRAHPDSFISAMPPLESLRNNQYIMSLLVCYVLMLFVCPSNDNAL